MAMVAVGAGVKIRSYKVISEAVENGVAYGLNRAHKHAEKPDHATLQDAIETAVINALCEVLDFGD